MALLLPTADEVEQIRQNNVDVISKYYFANYDYLKRYARAFCRRINNRQIYEDLIQQLFVDFWQLSFDNPRYFGRDCIKAFCRYYYGNQRKRAQLKDGHAHIEKTILDAPIVGGDKITETFGDTVASNVDVFALAFPSVDVSESLYNYLAGLLAPEQARVFERFYWTGETYNEVAEYLGKNPRTVKRTREVVFAKFRKHKDDIKAFLCNMDYDTYANL